MQLETLLSVALNTPMDDPNDPECIWGLPTVIWGSPGIGKSKRVKTTCKQINLPCRVTFPAGRQPEDVSGAPVADGAGGLRLVPIMGAINELIKLGHGVLFIDELSCARPAVQAAMLGLILDRMAGDVQLPGRVRVLLAANPTDEAAGGWNLEPPTANRMAHLELPVPSGADVANYLMGRTDYEYVRVDDGENLVRRNWTSAYGTATSLFAGLMYAKGAKGANSLVYSTHVDGAETTQLARPTPRSWEFALRAFATSQALGFDKAVGNTLVQACIGEGAAKEWVRFVAYADLPSPQEILTQGWKPDPKALDKTMAAYNAVAQYVCHMTDPAQQEAAAVATWKLYEEAIKMNLTDVVIGPAKEMVKYRLCTDRGTAVATAALPVMQKLRKFSSILGGSFQP